MARIYATLKRQVVTGTFLPGARLDPARLKDALAASTMPIRDVLQRLTGEGLVENSLNEGFRVVSLSEAAMRDLYIWCGDIARLCLARTDPHGELEPDPSLGGSYADEVTRMLLRISLLSPNHEYRKAMTSLCERSYVLRILEERLLHEPFHEVRALKNALDHGDWTSIEMLFDQFQETRMAILPAIASSMRDRATSAHPNIF
jgi:hypothetical protein